MEKGYEKDGNEAFIEKYANYLDYYNYWLYNTLPIHISSYIKQTSFKKVNMNLIKNCDYWIYYLIKQWKEEFK